MKDNWGLNKLLINDDMIKNNPEYYQNTNNENECIHLNPDYNPIKSYEIYMNFIWNSYAFHMNFICISYEIHIHMKIEYE